MKPIGLVLLIILLFGGSSKSFAGAELHLFDDFEASRLDQRHWWRGQLQRDSFWIDHNVSRSGSGSLAIRLNPDNHSCGAGCQRNEVRTSPERRIKFGQETWYSFSFRISGDLPVVGNTRWISGQWKQDTGGSPFLSQRFDRGVFHIAVHDGSCRVLVARAEGSLERIRTTIDTSKIDKHAFRNNKQAYRCDTDLIVEQGKSPLLPDPYMNWVDMVYRVRGGLDGTGLIEVWANNRFIVRVRGSIGYREVSGPNQFFKFGVYRDFMPGTVTVYFDNFRRSSNGP